MHARHDRLTDPELHEFLGRLFPNGFAGLEVLSEIAPAGWDKSPLVACFHPTAEQEHKEIVQVYRNLEALRAARAAKGAGVDDMASRVPTLDDIRSERTPAPIRWRDEVEDLVGLCLWDVFSDNHEVVAADGRIADIGSFRGAGAFLAEHISTNDHDFGEDYMRFYMGTFAISGRADLTPVYQMIFRRLHAHGGDWTYHFPEIHLGRFERDHDEEPTAPYSPNEALAKERKAREQELAIVRAEEKLAEINAQARERALDDLPPPTVRGYQTVYGRNPHGWPPA